MKHVQSCCFAHKTNCFFWRCRRRRHSCLRGSLSNYDDDHNDNLKNNRFNDQNNSSARASRSLVHFFDVHCTTMTWNLLIWRFMKDVDIRRRNFLPLFWTWIKHILEFNSRKSRPHLTYWAGPNRRINLKESKFIFLATFLLLSSSS